MQQLARTVNQTLSRAPICAVYNKELTRVWPHAGEERKKEVMCFAKENGWEIVAYMDGYCAIFIKRPLAKAKSDG